MLLTLSPSVALARLGLPYCERLLPHDGGSCLGKMMGTGDNNLLELDARKRELLEARMTRHGQVRASPALGR